jgi:acetyltransferase-like isoleucine patch superfamily enzyme
MKNTLFQSRYYTNEELKYCGFKKIGNNVMIHENVNIYGIENISIGDHVRIDPYASIIANGFVSIGSYVHIGSYCLLIGAEGITMENFSGLSQGVKIYTRSDDYSGEHLTNPTVPERYLGIKKGPVQLKKHVIVGANTVILPGVKVGEGSSVGAMSLVTKSLQSWGIYAGIPAKKIKIRSRKLIELEYVLMKESTENN